MKKKNNVVLIVLAAYNAEKTLKLSIESILNQTYKKWKLILIDDGSNDNTLKIINSYKDLKKIKIIRNKKRLGLTKSLNKAIRNESCTFIARMDADDFSLKKRLEKQVKFMLNNKNVSLLGTNVNYYDNHNNFIARSNLPLNNFDIKNLIIKKNPFVHSSIIFRKEFYDELGGYNEFFFNAQDYDMWLRGKENYEYRNLKGRFLNHKMKKHITFVKGLYGILAMITNLRFDKKFHISVIWIFISFMLLIIKQLRTYK